VIFINDHSYKYSIANQWLIHWFRFGKNKKLNFWSFIFTCCLFFVFFILSVIVYYKSRSFMTIVPFRLNYPPVRRADPPRSCTNLFTKRSSHCREITGCIPHTITMAEPSPPWPRRKPLILGWPSRWRSSSELWTTSTYLIPRWSVSLSDTLFNLLATTSFLY